MRLRMRSRNRQLLGQTIVPGFLVLCMILGGASAAGAAANLVLQIVAIALIYLALWVHPDVAITGGGRQLLGLIGLLLLLFALNLMPLPPEVWSKLPGRGPIANGYRLLGITPPWLPVSLAPHKTALALFWLLPSFATVLITLRAGAYKASVVAWTLVIAAVISVGLGALQLAGGPDSPAYLYHFTNYGVAVGFFANANHFGTLMLVTIPFLAALLTQAFGDRRDRKRASAKVMLVAAGLLVVTVGLAITGSLAAIGLAVPVAGASVLLIRAGDARPVPRWALPAVMLLGIAALAVVMSQPFGNNLTGKDANSVYSRRTAYEQTLAASVDFFPVGSGIGSFVDVYRSRENAAIVTNTYMNHAHSDPIEILLETGALGGVLVALFLLWWGRRAWLIWSGKDNKVWARAATIASGAVMAHSLVDYPLRTAAISCIFAFCLALMAGARERSFERKRTLEDDARHLKA